MRQILFLLSVLLVANAAFDQTYIQYVSRNGDSTIVKTMDMSLLAGDLTPDAFQKMESYCRNTIEVECSVDVANKVVTINDSFESGTYYSLVGDFGLPYTTYTVTISRIPTDRFSGLLQNVLIGSGEATSQGTAAVMDLNDKEKNQQSAVILKTLGTNLTYVVEMPSEVTGTTLGQVKGSRVEIDLVKALETSEPIVITSREINYGYLVAILGVIVLIIIAYMFSMSTKTKKKGTIKK